MAYEPQLYPNSTKHLKMQRTLGKVQVDLLFVHEMEVQMGKCFVWELSPQRPGFWWEVVHPEVDLIGQAGQAGIVPIFFYRKLIHSSHFS